MKGTAMRRLALRGLGLAALAVLGLSLLSSPQTKAGLPNPPLPPKPPPPPLSCVSSTPSRITLEVCGGTFGLPQGFTIEWVTLDEFNANGFANACAAQFTKAAGFAVGRNQCIDVDIGDNLLDE